MKKIKIWMICLMLSFSLLACNKDVSQKEYPYQVAFVNWSDDALLYTHALNSSAMLSSDALHLPVFKTDTQAELDTFKSTYQDILSFNQKLDEMPSFDDVTATYDKDFFTKSSLILVYVQASSGTYRFGLSQIECHDQTFSVSIQQSNHPETYNDMMAGWFVILEVDKNDISHCECFDAILER